jgi:hypothetical protein
MAILREGGRLAPNLWCKSGCAQLKDSLQADAVQGAAQDRHLAPATPCGCQARTAATARFTHRQRPAGNTPTTEQCFTIISRGSHLCPCDNPISRVARVAYRRTQTTRPRH